MFTHIYNPSNLGVGDQEDRGLRPALKGREKPPSQQNKQSMVIHTCNPSYLGNRDRTIMEATWAKSTPYLKNNESKKGWGCGSSSRVLV
jgi:hypothetical protein